MKVLKIKKVEDCLESTNVRDILMDSELIKVFIDHLGLLGKLIYYENFKKPFFKVIVRGEYTIKGAQGNKEFRVLLPENADDSIIERIMAHIEKYSEK